MLGSVASGHHSHRRSFCLISSKSRRETSLPVARPSASPCRNVEKYPCNSKGVQACSAASEASPASASAVPAQSSATANVGASVSQPMDLDAAWKFLKEFTVKMFRGLGAPYTSTREKRDRLRQALMLVYQSPWPPAGWVPPVRTFTSSSTSPSSDSTQQQGSSQTSELSSSSGSDDSNSIKASGSAPLVMIGLMAGDVKIGARALRDYCQALGLTYVIPEVRVAGAPRLSDVQGSVYIKYNSVSKICYVSPYQGRERGVLLQLGQEQLGHLPLGLFDEDMKNPPPPLE